MTGYKPSKKTFRVRFEDYPGLLVVCKSVNLGTLTKLNALAGSNDPDDAKAAFGFFAKRIITWNMEHPDLDDDDEETCPVCGSEPGAMLPSTVDGMMCLEVDFVMKLILGWVQAITSVPAPKAPNSSDGESSTTNGGDSALTRLGNLANQTKLPTLNSI